MPDNSKQLWDYVNQDKNRFLKLNDEGKKTYLQYGLDSKQLQSEKLTQESLSLVGQKALNKSVIMATPIVNKPVLGVSPATLPTSKFNLPSYNPDAPENQPKWFGAKWIKNLQESQIKKDYESNQKNYTDLQNGKLNIDTFGLDEKQKKKAIEDYKAKVTQNASIPFDQFRLNKYQNEENPNWTPSVNPENRVEAFKTDNPVLNFVQRTLNKGINTITMDDRVETPTTGSKIANTISDIGGTVLGYATPIAGMGGTLQKMSTGISRPVEQAIGSKISKPILNKVLSGAGREFVEGAALGGIEGAVRKMDTKDIGKKMLVEGGIGAVLGGTFEGIQAKLLQGKLEKIPTNETKEVAKEVPQTASKEIKSILNGNTFKVKNTALESAYSKYNEAIFDIQNHFGQWQLTPDEMARIKPELGIDLDEIVGNIEKAEKGMDLKGIANKQNLSYSAGVNSMPNKMLNKNLVGTPKLDLAPTPKPTVTPSTQSAVKFVSSSKNKSSFKETLSKFYTRMVDINNPIKKIDDKAYTLATNSKNVGGTVDYIMKDGLTNSEGKTIGKSLKAVVEDIPKGQEDEFWNYLGHRHNIDRATQGKNVFPDFDSVGSSNAVKRIELQNPEFKQKADNLVKFVDDFMEEWGHKSGLISDDTWKNLKKMYPNYFPTQRNFDEIEDGISNIFTNGKGFVNQSSPLKTAKGSARDIINPVENIMNLVNTTVRKARYNQVGQNIVDVIGKDPTGLKQFAEIVPEMTNANNVVKVLVQGEPVYVKINDKHLLESLEGLYKASGGDIEKVVRGITNKYKSLITTKNPFFALRNIARDVPTAYINGSQNNPIKFFTDLISAGKDLVKNTDVAKQYKALGGGGSNFFNSGDTAKSAKELTKDSLLKKIGGGVETFNSLTESTPRLAEFKRALIKTGDTQKALLASSDITTNFSRYGDITKKIDAGVPYLNAGVQGLDKLVRQFKDKPIQTVLKGATIITAPTLITNYVNKDNPNYKALDNRAKDNYFQIPNMLGDKDEKGYPTTFIKIPKSRELGVLFGSLTERILRQASGEKNAFKGYGETVATNFSPTNPIENNIASPLIYNIPTNKDFAGRTIVPRNMEDRSPKLQYDETTSEIGKKIGQLANLSPEQIDYLVDSYTGVIGDLLLPAATKKNYVSGKPLEKILRPISNQFVTNSLYSNSAIDDFYNNYDKLKRSAADKNFVNSLPSKLLTKEERLRNSFAKISTQISTLSKQIKEAEKTNDKERIKAYRKKMIELANYANSQIK